MQETQIQTLGQEDPLEKGMATHLNVLAWRISWTEETNQLQSMESQRIRHTHNWVTKTQHRHIQHSEIEIFFAYRDFFLNFKLTVLINDVQMICWYGWLKQVDIYSLPQYTGYWSRVK